MTRERKKRNYKITGGEKKIKDGKKQEVKDLRVERIIKIEFIKIEKKD